MITPKLTKPQQELLREIVKTPVKLYGDLWIPSRRLRRRGLADYRNGRLIPTDAGRTLTTTEETNLNQLGFKSNGGVKEPL